MFHHSEFADARQLTDRKQNTSISVCIPTLNEEFTIGPIVSSIRRELMESVPLVDEILVIDSGSSDRTCEVASAAGARVMLSKDISPEHGTWRGKGENLWKALFAAQGELICYVDGDITDFHPRFVTGPIGPLLSSPEISYVKSYYERPFNHSGGFHRSGGGRVSEILIRPLISLFYPELNAILQPLSGEYAARRSLLETLSFPAGYGVEIAHLIDLLYLGHLSSLAQVDLDQRIHRNRSDEELGRMSSSILRTVLQRLERDQKLSLHSDLATHYYSWSHTPDGMVQTIAETSDLERPPVVSLR